MRSIFASTPLRLTLLLALILSLSGAIGWLAGFSWVLSWLFGTVTGVILLVLFTPGLARIEATLDNMIANRSTEPIPYHRWDPFSPLARLVNRLLETGHSVGNLRDDLRTQIESAAAQQERNHLARELHDSIKQQLFSMQMSAAAAEARLESDPEAARTALADVRKSAREALVEMNALLQQLAPAPLEKVGLVQALRDQCEALSYRTGAQVDCAIGELPENAQLPPRTQETLFRIVQETLSNIARHARAGQVEVRLSGDEAASMVELEIRDNGQGFDPEHVFYGSGIPGIRERVAALRGQLTLESRPGEGTRLHVSLPLSEPAFEAVDLAPAQRSPATGRTVLAGMLGGLLIAGVLWYPWYVQVLGEYAPEPTLPGSWGSLGLIAAAALALLTGWLAGRWVGSGSTFVGAAAGGIAGVTGYGLLGGAWAATRGAKLLLDTGPVRVQPEPEALRLLTTAFFGTFVTTHLLFWVMLLAGLGLGALGGLLARKNAFSLPAERMDRLTFFLLTPALISSGLAMLVQFYLLPVAEGSFVGLLQAGEVTGTPLWLVQAAVLGSLGTPLFFYLAAMRTRYDQLKRRLHAGDRLASAAWEAFFLAAWAGLGALISLFLMALFQLQFSGERSGATAAILTGWVYILLNGLIGLWMIVLLAQIRRKMVSTGARPPSFALYLAIIAGPLVPVLGFAALFLGWLRSGVLVVLGVEVLLLLYVRFRGAEPAPLDRRQAAQETREAAADIAAAWPGMVYGTVLPVLAMGSAGSGILQIVIGFAEYLMDGLSLDVGLSMSTTARGLSAITQRILANAYLIQGAGFVALLLLAGVMVGVVLLGVSLRAAGPRRP